MVQWDLLRTDQVVRGEGHVGQQVSFRGLPPKQHLTSCLCTVKSEQVSDRLVRASSFAGSALMVSCSLKLPWVKVGTASPRIMNHNSCRGIRYELTIKFTLYIPGNWTLSRKDLVQGKFLQGCVSPGETCLQIPVKFKETDRNAVCSCLSFQLGFWFWMRVLLFSCKSTMSSLCPKFLPGRLPLLQQGIIGTHLR